MRYIGPLSAHGLSEHELTAEKLFSRIA
eukprot:SAG11_NODE_22185_length_410_cov_1.868167_1_plen_27_part_01